MGMDFPVDRRRAIYVIGIAGGTGSGKTRLAGEVQSRVGEEQAVVLPHDAYYRDLAHLPVEARAGVNFDHPDALETELLVAHLDALGRGEAVEVPAYDFSTHTRQKGAGARVAPRPVVIVEGILIFTDWPLRERMDLKVFVETAADLRLIRRMERDTKERGRSPTSVMEQYLATVQPMHDRFVEPNKRYADLILPGGKDNRVAVDLLVDHVGAVLSG